MDKATLTLFGAVAIAATAAIFVSRKPEPPAATPEPPHAPAIDPNTPLPEGHPPLDDMPPGHPPVGGTSTAQAAPMMKGEAGLTWTVPARWKEVPHPSTMRIATYSIPKAAGDAADAEMSVTRAGGEVEANAKRWVDQFDVASRPSVKRSTKTIGALKVHLVDGAGGFTTMSGEVQPNWAMLGAIVETADGSHFFKLMGPKKTVEAARSEFDALIASVKTK